MSHPLARAKSGEARLETGFFGIESGDVPGGGVAIGVGDILREIEEVQQGDERGWPAMLDCQIWRRWIGQTRTASWASSTSRPTW